MSSSSDNIRTKKVTREKLARLTKNHELTVLMESLGDDVSKNIPDAIDQIQLSAMFGPTSADGSKALAQFAQRTAVEVQALVAACQRQGSQIAALRTMVEQLQMQLMAAEGRLSSGITRVAAANEETRALVIGV